MTRNVLKMKFQSVSHFLKAKFQRVSHFRILSGVWEIKFPLMSHCIREICVEYCHLATSTSSRGVVFMRLVPNRTNASQVSQASQGFEPEKIFSFFMTRHWQRIPQVSIPINHFCFARFAISQISQINSAWKFHTTSILLKRIVWRLLFCGWHLFLPPAAVSVLPLFHN